MSFRAAFAATALFAAATTAQAGSITLDLGPSAQDYVLYGQGAIAPDQGSFTNQQGSESYNSGTNTTTESLTGSITGSSDPGIASGTYDFVTTFLGIPIGSGGTEIQSYSSAPGSDYFYYGFIDPSVNMTLYLTGTPSGSLAIPLYAGGVFDEGFSFSFVNSACTGVAICDQNTVGLTPGATESSSAEIFVTLTSSTVPEPSCWALLLAAFAGLGFVRWRASPNRSSVAS
jgi:hypothetical protein